MLAVGSAILLGAASSGSAQTVGYSSSVFVARTTFETEQFDAVYVFNSVDITGGPFRLVASVPFIHQRVTSADSMVDPAAPSTLVTNTGFGDPLIRLDVRLVDDWSRRLQVGVSGSVKPEEPTI